MEITNCAAGFIGIAAIVASVPLALCIRYFINHINWNLFENYKIPARRLAYACVILLLLTVIGYGKSYVKITPCHKSVASCCGK